MVRLTADDSLFRRGGDAEKGGERRGNHVVRRFVENVHLAHEALRCLLDVVHRGNGGGLHLEPLAFGVVLHGLDLEFGIDFAGAVDGTDGLGVGIELLQKIDLFLDGAHIAGSGDVALGGFVAGGQVRPHIIGDGGADDGDLLRQAGHGLRCRCGNGVDEIDFVAQEALPDVLQVRLVGLGILPVDGEVLSLFEAALFQALDKSLVGRVQCAVFHQLHDAHLVLL